LKIPPMCFCLSGHQKYVRKPDYKDIDGGTWGPGTLVRMLCLCGLPLDVLSRSVRTGIGLVSDPVGTRMMAPVKVRDTSSSNSPIETWIQCTFIRCKRIVGTQSHIAFDRIAVPIIQIRQSCLRVGLVSIYQVLRRL